METESWGKLSGEEDGAGGMGGKEERERAAPLPLVLRAQQSVGKSLKRDFLPSLLFHRLDGFGRQVETESETMVEAEAGNKAL